MSPVEILYPADHVRKNPERYWNGNPSPGADDVNTAIASQLRDDGCRKIEIRSRDGWQLVCCELDWAKTMSAQFGNIGRLFEGAVGIPGPVAGGLRVEWFVALLASAIRVYVDGHIVYSQGAPDPGGDEGAAYEFQGSVCIAYLLDDRECKAVHR